LLPLSVFKLRHRVMSSADIRAYHGDPWVAYLRRLTGRLEGSRARLAAYHVDLANVRGMNLMMLLAIQVVDRLSVVVDRRLAEFPPGRERDGAIWRNLQVEFEGVCVSVRGITAVLLDYTRLLLNDDRNVPLQYAEASRLTGEQRMFLQEALTHLSTITNQLLAYTTGIFRTINITGV